ncbi:hypothetical protein CWB96_11230 [Pseudoalteromonas citrea]|uniref:Uncharacterized protein n=1 Tax=Pseudoalteromonas citrea TaxID=43655 RepID=A0A5S3XNS5_9GAMM|nr:hypothetical protein CWB97_12005 [Pseudoalteromonas citrea]TMP58741.1 hypothetical protein CWB96_11230 [Pseudoalteromonas citrea]
MGKPHSHGALVETIADKGFTLWLYTFLCRAALCFYNLHKFQAKKSPQKMRAKQQVEGSNPGVDKLTLVLSSALLSQQYDKSESYC